MAHPRHLGQGFLNREWAQIGTNEIHGIYDFGFERTFTPYIPSLHA